MSKKTIMVEPLPGGFKYGFPKELPKEAIEYYGTNDYGINAKFDITGWFEKNGYPLEQYKKYKWWVVDSFDPDIHGGGVESFGSYYPGGCAQE